MITQNQLPKSYTPYQNLTVCSNTLIGGGNLIAIGEILPLLVGSGEESPKVWLQAPNQPNGKNYIPLVTASVATHPNINIITNNQSLSISIFETIIIHITQINSESAIIDQLDLRQIGLNIYGDSNSLVAGGSTFSHNIFSGVGTLLGFNIN